MKKVFYILLLVLFIGLALRLYPTLISGMPFSTDGWPIIRNTNLLIQNTPTPLTSKIFDGYNNFWPASSIFSAILSQIDNLAPIYTMAIAIPIVATLTIPIFYLVAKKITQNTTVALIAAALLSTAFPLTLYMAGVTKETFAAPIFMAVILLFLLKHDWKTTLLFCTASIALVLAHHLTAFFAVGIVATLSVALYTSKNRPQQSVNSNKSNILFITIISTITALDFGFTASAALPISITANDVLTVGAYLIAVAALVLYFVYIAKNFSRKRTILNSILAFLGLIVFMFVLTKIPLLPTAPTLPVYYFIYALPFIIACPIAIFALNELYQKSSSLTLPLFWLIPVIAFAAFAIFANPPEGQELTIRCLNFLLPPVTILIAIGLYKLANAPKHVKARKFTKLFAALIIVSMVTVNAYSLYSTVSLQEPYLGYFWRYEPSEYQASNWIVINGNNQTIAGDSKVYYLLQGYFDENVSILQGLEYLQGNGSAPHILYIYNQMYKNGYVLYDGTPITLPANWTNTLSNYNLIYSNNEVTIYAKR